MNPINLTNFSRLTIYDSGFTNYASQFFYFRIPHSHFRIIMSSSRVTNTKHVFYCLFGFWNFSDLPTFLRKNQLFYDDKFCQMVTAANKIDTGMKGCFPFNNPFPLRIYLPNILSRNIIDF